eukprot:4158683-Prymnesium_polylepis.1
MAISREPDSSTALVAQLVKKLKDKATAERLRQALDGGATLEWWSLLLEEGERPALLRELQRLGIASLSERQAVANALGRARRDGSLPRPAPLPELSLSEVRTRALELLRSSDEDSRQEHCEYTMFEKSSKVGGVWSANYANFGLQVPKELCKLTQMSQTAHSSTPIQPRALTSTAVRGGR